jgi:hypothetical protein
MRFKAILLCLATVSILAVLVPDGYSQSAKKISKKKSTQTAKKPVTANRTDSVKTTSQVPATLPGKKDTAGTRESTPPPPKFVWRKASNSAFAVGERLVFEVDYGFINAGTAVMTIPQYETVAGRNTYRVEFNVDSHPSFNWVFKVEDRYRTFIDAESLVPLKFEQHIREGGYKHDFLAEFDQINHIVHTFPRDFRIPEYVHDIMSAFYYYRTLDLSGVKDGEIMEMRNFYDDTTYVLGVKFLGRQELEIGIGTFKTLVVEPLISQGGLFKSEGRIVIWLTDDDLKVPLRVNTKVVIGSIDTELKEYSGLAGTIRARIK